MAMTLLEKIIASHSKFDTVHPGEIVDVSIDIRAARDFGGANVVRNLRDYDLEIDNPSKTVFTFDCNPTGSDQNYAVNQHACRLFARENGIKVFDIDSGIGTHILIDEGYIYPGATAVSTDSHANILGAVGAFGQGMGDMDIAASWNKGKVWFKVPPSVKMNFHGDLHQNITSKDFVLNLLKLFGADSLLGQSVEVYGKCIDKMNLDDRITVSSMATEMGAIIILFAPSDKVLSYCRERVSVKFNPVYADIDALYDKVIEIDVSDFVKMVSKPGAPHDTVDVTEVEGIKVDSVFIGSCTNGRMQDMLQAASVLRGRKVAPGVILKIVPSTDVVWRKCLDDGIISVFKSAGALVSNPGCAGCAAGQVGQNGQGEITVSTGNRNFAGKQGKGSVYLASPAIAASSAVAGYITTPDRIPDHPMVFTLPKKTKTTEKQVKDKKISHTKPSIIEGRIWLVQKDNIDTDMIYHNRYLTITDIVKMGQYAFDNLKGFEDFSSKAKPGDIIVTGKNFGCGSSRQQAVDCFISLGIQAIISESFGAIYERNAINAGLPVITCKSINELDLTDESMVKIDLKTYEITNIQNKRKTITEPFSEVQFEIYQKGTLLG
jgi:3-isopropylmalate/(R)-2-methylmalate dehydratase large subunit